MELDGCLSTPDTGCHIWQGNQYPPSGFGMYRTINTWWYSANPDTIFNASLAVQVATPDSIVGYDSVCFEPNQNNSYSLSPNPLPGAQNYEWHLFQDTISLQSWNTLLPCLDSVFFPDTGSYSLISRGYNNCGYGIPDTLHIKVFSPDTISISISSSVNEICEGTLVIFTATSFNGGPSPVFHWKVNGVNQGINDSVFSYASANGDEIVCVLTSSITVCTANNPATSNSILMTIYPLLPVAVSIIPSNDTVCEGSQVTFTANAINGGINPSYQWQVNGVNVGTNNPVFTYYPASGDLVSCILTSSEQCTVNNPVSSIQYPVSVIATPVVTFTPCFDTVTTTNARPIRLKGGIPLGGGRLFRTGSNQRVFLSQLSRPWLKNDHLHIYKRCIL